MGCSIGSSLITDGLILNLDIGNIKSYPLSGTVITDLSGMGNHHTLVGSFTYTTNPTSLVFNETVKSIDRSSSLTGASKLGTVVIWYRNNDTYDLWCRGSNSNTVYLCASYPGQGYYYSNCGSPSVFVDLKACTNPVTDGYKNGATYHMWEAKNVDLSLWTYFQWFGYTGGFELNGNVAAIMVYNRVLTANESKQNFSALRGRFGI